MYAKVSGTTVERFPYTLKDLKADNPGVSFSSATTLDDVAQYGVVQVTQNADPAYDPATQRLEQGVPVESGGSWSVTRVVTALTAEEQAQKAAESARAEDIAAMKADPQVLTLLKARPNQINSYIENNVTDLASAKDILKIYGRALAVLAYTIVN